MRGVCARRRRSRGAPQVGVSAADRRRHRPVEFGAGDEIVRGAERCLRGFSSASPGRGILLRRAR
jgi:hypothetical protein